MRLVRIVPECARAASNIEPEGAPMSVLSVVRLSDSFAEVWPQLATGLGIDLTIAVPNGVDAVPPAAAAVLLAAGGAAQEALDWLDRHHIPAGIPVFVIGSDPGRRAAAQAVGHGAADYFALPDDIEILSNALAVAVGRRRPAARNIVPGATTSDLTAFREIAGESP